MHEDIYSFCCWNVLALHLKGVENIWEFWLIDLIDWYIRHDKPQVFPQHLWEPGLSSSFCRCHLEALEEPNDILSMFLHRSKCVLHINWCRISSIDSIKPTNIIDSLHHLSISSALFFFFRGGFRSLSVMSFKNTFPGAMTWLLLVCCYENLGPKAWIQVEPLKMTGQTRNPRHQKIIYVYSNWWIFEGHETEINCHNYETWDSFWYTFSQYIASMLFVNVKLSLFHFFSSYFKVESSGITSFCWSKLMESCSPIHKIDQKTRFFPNISGQLTRENQTPLTLWTPLLVDQRLGGFNPPNQSTKLPGGDFLGIFSNEKNRQRCTEDGFGELARFP